MIRINAFFELAEDEVQESLLLGKQLVKASRNDRGCISYDLFHSTTRPNVMMFCETWNNEEDLKAHSETEHFVRLVPELKQRALNTKTEQFEF